MHALRSFAAAAEAQNFRSPVESMARAVYAIVILQGLITASILLAQGFRIDAAVWALLFPWPFLIAGGMALRRLGRLRLASAFEATGLIHLQALASSFLIVGVTTYAPRYADDLLASWDRALHFPWAGFVDAFRPYPKLMARLYDAFLWQSLVLIGFLSWKGMHERIWTFVTAATLSLSIAAVIFMFFPAKAPYIHYGIQELAGQSAGTRFLEPVEYIRNGGRHFSLKLFSGCITFPSYHASCGLLYCWAAWPTFLRWPSFVVNMAMLVGAIVIGGHYFVDLPAGILLAVLALGVSSQLVRSSRSNGVLPASARRRIRATFAAILRYRRAGAG